MIAVIKNIKVNRDTSQETLAIKLKRVKNTLEYLQSLTIGPDPESGMKSIKVTDTKDVSKLIARKQLIDEILTRLGG
jgi:ribosome-binding protein aMBF1 (putative translation factor)